MNNIDNKEKTVEEILKDTKDILSSFNSSWEIWKLLDEYNKSNIGALAFIGSGKNFVEICLIDKTNSTPIKSEKRYAKNYKDSVPGGFLMTSLSHALYKNIHIEWLRSVDKNINRLYSDIENYILDVDVKLLNAILTRRSKDLIDIFNCKYHDDEIPFYFTPGTGHYDYITKGVTYFPFLLYNADNTFGFSFDTITLKSNSIFPLIYSEFVECIKANLALKKCVSCGSLIFTNTQQKYCYYCNYPSETKEEARLRKQIERIIKSNDMWTQIEFKIKHYMKERNYNDREINKQLESAKIKFDNK